MATSQPESRTVDDDKMCSICREKIKTPRYLPCKHYFCHECLSSYIISQTKNCKACGQYRNLNIKATIMQYTYVNAVKGIFLCLAIIICAPDVCVCFAVLDLSVQHAIKIHSSQEILKIPRSGPVFFPLTFPPKNC